MTTITDAAKVTIGKNFKFLLDAEELTAAEFSRRTKKARPNWRESLISELLHGKRFPSQEFVQHVDEVYGVNLLHDTGLKLEDLRGEKEHTKTWLKRTGQRDKLTTAFPGAPEQPFSKTANYRMHVDKTEKVLSLYDGSTYIGSATAQEAGISLDDFEPGWQPSVSFAHVERITSAIAPPLQDKMTEQLAKWAEHQVLKEAEASVALDGETQSDPDAQPIGTEWDENAHPQPVKEQEEVVIDTPQVTTSGDESVTVRIQEGVCTVTIGGFSMSMTEGEFTIGNGGNASTSSRKGSSVQNRGLAAKVLTYLEDNADKTVADSYLAEYFGVDLKAIRNAGSYLMHQDKVDRSIKKDGHHFQALVGNE